MINVESDSLFNLNKSIVKGLKSCQGALMYDTFIKKVLNQEYEKHKHEFPKTIKIPKPLTDLLKGDATPAREFVLEDAPRLSDGTPVWFMEPNPGVLVNFGYRNGDSRYISNVSLDDQFIHMFAGGRTGMGKSVLVNSLIFSMAFMYAPWDLKLCLFDPKIAEFKRYGLDGILPHIEVIGATSDSDFIITSLQYYKKEMEMINQMFPIHGCNNISSFKKKTGLSFPKMVLVMDEVQAGITNAGKRAVVVQEAIDGFARLGRNSGRHLLLASQQVGSSIPAETMRQISVRAALGCSEIDSNVILGNPMAKKIKTKGRILVTTDIEEHSPLSNVEYRVPYQSDDLFVSQKKELCELGKKYNFKYPVMFYNQTDYVYEGQDFIDYIAKNNPNKDLKIVLGEPSYYKEGNEKSECIVLDGGDMENIMCICNTRDSLERFTKMIAYNCDYLKDNLTSIVIYKDPKDLEFLNTFSFKSLQRTKSLDSKVFEQVMSLIYDRTLMIEIDESIFELNMNYNYSDSVIDDIYDDVVEAHPIYNSDLNKKRCAVLYNIIGNRNYDKFYKTSMLREENLKQFLSSLCCRLFRRYELSDCNDRQLTSSHFKKQLILILGLNSISGFENFPNRNALELFVSAVSMSYEVNITFFFSTTILDESTSVSHCCRYFLLDNTNPNVLPKIKCDCFPDKKPGIAGVLFDKSLFKLTKFKKMVFTDEIISD